MNIHRLAIIDDDRDFCDFVERVAAKCGFDVFATTDPQALITEVMTVDPGVIVLDLMMPETDGVELLRELSRLGSRANIILVSGSDQRVIDSASRLGREGGLKIFDRLQKPIPLQTLRALFKRLLPRRIDLTAEDLEAAIADEQLVMHYQPRLHLASRQITGVEALARWQHPTRGLIMPSEFFPLAGGRKLLTAITEWAFGATVRQAQAWGLQCVEPTISVNLSPADLADPDRPDKFAALCADHGVEPKRFIFELSETDVMSDPTRLMDFYTRLRLKGFQLAIDDFGSGFSSLVQLVRLPFSELKIDMSFVSSMLHSDDSRIIVETAIGMGRSLRMVTVAEGVESALALAALQTMNCDYAQGYHISRPVVAERIPSMVIDSWTAAIAA